MKKIISLSIICVFLVSNFLFLTSCNRKEKENEAFAKGEAGDGHDISFPVYNSDIITDQEFTIEKASSRIFKDFKTQWVYASLDDFLNALGITKNAKINKRTIDNFYQTLEGFINEYVIESDKYNLIIMHFSTIPDKYYLSSIEINIKDNGYSELFPYADISDYQKDNKFGSKMDIPGRSEMISYAMRYGDDENMGYSDLKFKDGNLDTICIRMYWP